MKTRAYFTTTLTKGKTTFKSGKNGSEELKVLCQSAEVAGHQMNKRIDPRIFRKNTAEDYLRAAIETASWIDTLAVKTQSMEGSGKRFRRDRKDIVKMFLCLRQKVCMTVQLESEFS